MIRKIFLLAAFLVSMVVVNAQSVGEWDIWTQFSGNFDDVVETPQKVYYTSGSRLFSYDKEANETFAYSTKNKLNDTNVKMIRYNPEGKYLFVSYDNANIDLLYENERVVNLSDIKEATLPYNKGINDVAFANGRIYLATEFGIVIFDEKNQHVIESGIFGESVPFILPVDKFLFILKDGLKYAPMSGHHNTLDKFKHYTGIKADMIEFIGNNTLLYSTNGGPLNRMILETSGETPQTRYIFTHDDVIPSGRIMKGKNNMYLTTSTHLVKLDEKGEPVEYIALPNEIKGQTLATWEGPQSVWAANADGIANYKIEGGELTLLSDKFKPEGIVTDRVFIMKFDYTGALWLGNIGVTNYKSLPEGPGDWAENCQATTRIKDGKPEDMNVLDATVQNYWSKFHQNNSKTKKLYGGCSGFAVDPENPNRYYQGNNMEGLYVIEDQHQVHLFSWEKGNAPFPGFGFTNRVMDVIFDPEGNLWAGTWTNSGTTSPVHVLPKSVLRGKELSQIKKADWLPSKHLGVDVGRQDFTFFICEQSPVMFTYHGGSHNPLGVLFTKGTWGDPSDDEFITLINPQDQDGKAWEPERIICAIEDKRGRVWVGGSEGGIIEIADPSTLTATSRVTRIKVPRNDGTNYADYLCETDRINAMAVDSSNRKWIATEASGVFLVSENGDEIIENFTMENSPLPTNQVLTVACDPNSNTVYFGLLSGLMTYNSTSAPSADDYSEIYAYPNPVRPDYTGYITITNLMDNSLVKITDASGNIVFQTRSEGGMAVWDGMDANHNPVKTGVYFVFASQDENGSSSGAVTKIMIVR